MTQPFKLIAKLEGISLLLLFFFAMPMKYLVGNPIYVRTIGMAHGLLFIAYIFLAIYLKIEENWKARKMAEVMLASIIPFGTFYIEKKHFSTKKLN